MRRREGETIERESMRLLRALDSADGACVVDPTDETFVIARATRHGVSVGAGRFRLAAAERLVREDLLMPCAVNGRAAFRLSDAGRAFMRRHEAAPGYEHLAQHHELAPGVATVGGTRAAVMMDVTESPLAWLRRRKDASGRPYVDEASYEAGERLRRDLTLAAILPHGGVRWDGIPSDGCSGRRPDLAFASEATVAARQRVTHALTAVGPDFADLLIDLCGFLKGLARIEHERGWPARAGKVVARLALARLADHYGLAREARGPDRSRGIRSWREAALQE